MEKDLTFRKRACDSCHRRKIHCDAGIPKCNWCTHHGLECTFSRVSKAPRRPVKKKTHVELLAERLERIEDRIARARETLQHTGRTNQIGVAPAGTTSPATAGSAPASPPSDVRFGKIHFAGCYIGEISSYSGVPFFSAEGQRWIESRTGQKATLEALFASGPPWQTRHGEDPCLSAAKFPESSLDFGLPDRVKVEQYLSRFVTSKFWLIFPVVDPVLFQNTMDLAYSVQTGLPSLDVVAAQACVFAFLALVSLLHEEFGSLPTINADALALRVQYLLPQILQELSLTTLQTLFILCLRQLFSGRLQMASMFHSLAVRIIFMLGAHTRPSPQVVSYNASGGLDTESRVKSQLRKLFWLCYTFDKEISLRTGQPPAIDDDHCDLSLPPGYLEIKYIDVEWGARDRDDITAPPILPGDLRLTLLKSKISKLLYSAEAMRKSDAQLLRDIRELDDALEKWRLSIPPVFRPTLSVSPDVTLDPDVKLEPHRSMQKIIMNIEYHYVMATIHQASSRCRAWNNHGSGEMSGINSSLTLSLEASRSTLYFLRVAVPELFGEAFWMLVFYPMSAILTIFCHVLMNPLSPQSESDLELLNSAPELIKSMRMRRKTQDEIMQLNLMDEFVEELARLGNCAITRAREGRRPEDDSMTD